MTPLKFPLKNLQASVNSPKSIEIITNKNIRNINVTSELIRNLTGVPKIKFRLLFSIPIRIKFRTEFRKFKLKSFEALFLKKCLSLRCILHFIRYNNTQLFLCLVTPKLGIDMFMVIS